MLSHASVRRAVPCGLPRLLQPALPQPQLMARPALPATRSSLLAHVHGAAISHTRSAFSTVRNQPPRPAASPQAAAPAAAAATQQKDAHESAPEPSEAVEYGAAWQAPRAAAPPPIMLPRWLENLVSWARGGARSTTQIRSGRLYNFCRAHPLATPSPKELQLLKAQHAEQAARNARHPPFVSPSVRIRSLGLNDDELTRFRLIGVHMWMLQKMLLVSVNGADAQLAFAGKKASTAEERTRAIDLNASQKRLVSYLFENFWLELTPYLLEVRGEMKLTRTLQEVQEHFYALFYSLDVAWLEAVEQLQAEAPQPPSADRRPGSVSGAQQTSGVEGLAAVLWRNLYVGDTRVKKRDVFVLTLYLVRQMQQLATVPHDDLWHLGPSLAWRLDGALPKYTDNIDELLTRTLKVQPSLWRNNDYHEWLINNLPDNFTIDFKSNK